jgi:hypothetical protein
MRRIIAQAGSLQRAASQELVVYDTAESWCKAAD